MKIEECIRMDLKKNPKSEMLYETLYLVKAVGDAWGQNGHRNPENKCHKQIKLPEAERRSQCLGFLNFLPHTGCLIDGHCLN